jgi:hypothetical protein
MAKSLFPWTVGAIALKSDGAYRCRFRLNLSQICAQPTNYTDDKRPGLTEI